MSTSQKGYVFIKIFLVFFIAVLIAHLGYISRVSKLAENDLKEFFPRLSEMLEGKYTGSFSPDGFDVASVSFSVNQKSIKDFKINTLLSTPGYGADADILKAVKNKGLGFDAVTGATSSSNIVKAALKDAIENGPEL
jgi:uncharacterized protein with FMN-binding domain